MENKLNESDTRNSGKISPVEDHTDVYTSALTENVVFPRPNENENEKEEKDQIISTEENFLFSTENVKQEESENNLTFVNQTKPSQAKQTQPTLGIVSVSPRRQPKSENSPIANCGSRKKERVIGLGTVGLFQTDNDDKSVPKGVSAFINGTMVVGSLNHVRKVRNYLEWREKHKELFLDMKRKSPRQLIKARLQRFKKQAQQREEKAHVYAAAVRRMRRRGWSIAEKSPRNVDHTHFAQIKAKRDAVCAAREEAALRKISESSKQKNIILQQLATNKKESQRLTNLLREAARSERERQDAMREKRLEDIRHIAELAHAERVACRERINESRALEEKNRQQYRTFLRERVLAKSPRDCFSFTWSYTTKYPPGDWRRTFVSPLRTIRNGSDEKHRKQWIAELQEERLAMGRSQVEFVKQGRTSERREASQRNNIERAEALRKESEALRERKQRLEEDMMRFSKALHEHESEERKRRCDVFNAILQKKRELAAQQRRAIEEEELMARTLVEKNIQKLREQAALVRNVAGRLPPSPAPPSPYGFSLEMCADMYN